MSPKKKSPTNSKSSPVVEVKNTPVEPAVAKPVKIEVTEKPEVSFVSIAQPKIIKASKKPVEKSILSYRRLIKGIAKYEVHIFHPGNHDPICGQPYGVFDQNPLKMVHEDEVCPNCDWEKSYGKFRS